MHSLLDVVRAQARLSANDYPSEIVALFQKDDNLELERRTILDGELV